MKISIENFPTGRVTVCCQRRRDETYTFWLEDGRVTYIIDRNGALPYKSYASIIDIVFSFSGDDWQRVDTKLEEYKARLLQE